MRALKLVVLEGFAAILVFAAIGCGHQPGSTTAQAEIASPPAQVSSATNAAAPELVNSATATPCPPSNQKIPIKHVFLIVLENKSYERTFADDSKSKLKDLATQGKLLTEYYGIGHNSMDNYIAMISGQAPNPVTQMDCPVYIDIDEDRGAVQERLKERAKTLQQHLKQRWNNLKLHWSEREQENTTSLAAHQSAVDKTASLIGAQQLSDKQQDEVLQKGAGCIYPLKRLTIANQLQTAGPGWRAYMEGMSKPCEHPRTGEPDLTALPNWLHQNPSQYTPRHNPFVYFRSLVGEGDGLGSCSDHDVPLGYFDDKHPGLQYDLEHKLIPGFVFISPNLCNDGHSDCSSPKIKETDKARKADQVRNAEMTRIDEFVDTWVTAIMHSDAYNDGGLIIVTFDEAEVPKGLAPDDEEPDPEAEVDRNFALSCCGEKPGPGWKSPGLKGPGGGKVGAILISKSIHDHSPDRTNKYNHYSMLRSIEDFFDLDHLGYASQDGLNTFQACGVFNDLPKPQQ